MKVFDFLRRRAGVKENLKVEEDENISKKRVKNTKTPQEYPEEFVEKLTQTIFGVRFPWEAVFFVVVGLLSEVVDAMFMNETLEILGKNIDSTVTIIISYIVGAGCFFSMAFVGFQLGNRRYYTKTGERISYAFWAIAGFSLVIAKLLAGLVDGGLDDVITGRMELSELLVTEEFMSNAIIAAVQAVLYVGTGFMTRDSVRILTDNDIREYFLARRTYKKLLEQLSEQRGDIVEDISKLKAYPKYAKRLANSKRSVKKNVAQYNQSARALIEARMAITVEPDLMEDMYDNAMKKEGHVAKNGN